LGYLHPETAQIKVVIDRLRQEVRDVAQPQLEVSKPKAIDGKSLKEVVSAEGIEPSTY
jgi:hypothetical protein